MGNTVDNTYETKKEEILNGSADIVPKVEEDVSKVPKLNVKAAFESLSKEEQKEVLALANAIDVTQLDKVMAYGSGVLTSTFDQCGALLKDERGSNADQRVIEQVIELSNKANKMYDDFKLVLKKPGLIEKLFLKASRKGGKSHTEKLQKSAISNFNLLIELKQSCEDWLDMLKNAMAQVAESVTNDIDTANLLDKYIIAGKMALEQAKERLEELKENYENTGMQNDAYQYNNIKEGTETFEIVIANLEKSRAMHSLSVGQLALIGKANKNVQMTVYTQKNNSMALIGQQLRNAVLDAKNREVIEGQQAIIRLSDELIKKVSENVGNTAKESENILRSGFYSVEAAKEAVTTVISSCEEIKKVAEEMLPKMRADMNEIDGLINELEPYVNKVKQEESVKSDKTKIENSSAPNGTLSF